MRGESGGPRWAARAVLAALSCGRGEMFGMQNHAGGAWVGGVFLVCPKGALYPKSECVLQSSASLGGRRGCRVLFAGMLQQCHILF